MLLSAPLVVINIAQERQFSVEAAGNLLTNPGFESGSSNMPASWERGFWSGTRSTWDWVSDGSTVRSGMGSAKITSLQPNDATWIQDVSVEPYSSYLFKGWIKTDNVVLSDPPGGWSTGANLSVYLSFNRSPGIWGTQDWTEESLFFCSAASDTVTVVARIGYHWSLTTGTAYFDDMSLEETDPPFTGQHIVVCLLPEHRSLLTDQNSWLQKLDDVYLAFQDLTGQTPYDGDKILIQEVASYPGGALIAGNPILWFGDYVPDDLQAINTQNDLSFGPVHEMSHDFDLVILTRYYMGGNPMHAEHWANFKLTYAADTLSSVYPTSTFSSPSGYIPIGEFSHTYFVEQFARPWIDSGRTDWQNMSGDAYTGLLYMLREQIGWEPFKKTFRDFAMLTTPPPTTDLGKVELFAHLLSKNAVADVTPQFRSWGFDIASPPDTLSPTVTVTSPLGGELISGTVSVSASASDNTGVTKVEFYHNTTNLIATDTTSPYSATWNTTTVSNGSYALTAKAYDAAGNIGVSSPLTVTVSNDISPPIVSNGQPSGTLAAGTTQATLSLATNENATCKYGTTAGTSYVSLSTTFSSTGGTSHSSVVTGLTNGSSYAYYARCRDQAGNANANDFVISFSIDSPAPPDTTPPVVSLFSPSSGLTLCCRVAIAAIASDNIGVVKVEFWLNGRTLLTTITTTPHSYYWDTTTVPNSDYTIAAKAYDATGNYAISNFSTVTIVNQQPEPAPTPEPEPGSSPVVDTSFISEGALIRAIDDIDVYVVKYIGSKKFKRLILSPHVFESYGHLRWQDVKDVDQSIVDAFTMSDMVRATVAGDPRVYRLFPNGDIGTKRWIKTAEAFNRLGYDWDAIYTINETDRDAYSEGATIE